MIISFTLKRTCGCRLFYTKKRSGVDTPHWYYTKHSCVGNRDDTPTRSNYTDKQVESLMKFDDLVTDVVRND